MSRFDGFNIIRVLGVSVLVGLIGYILQPTGLSSLAFAEESPAPEGQAQEGQGGVTDRGIPLGKGSPSSSVIEIDARPLIQGRTFSDGVHFLVRDKGGFVWEVVAKGGKIIEYIAKDPKGNRVPTRMMKSSIHCKICEFDDSGREHCMIIECPKDPKPIGMVPNRPGSMK